MSNGTDECTLTSELADVMKNRKRGYGVSEINGQEEGLRDESRLRGLPGRDSVRSGGLFKVTTCVSLL